MTIEQLTEHEEPCEYGSKRGLVRRGPSPESRGLCRLWSSAFKAVATTMSRRR